MTTFTYIPDWAPTPDQDLRIKRSRFGDGYEQRSEDGLNAIQPTWKLTFSRRTQAEAQAIQTWLVANKAYVNAFDWAAPGEGTVSNETILTGDGTRNTAHLSHLGRVVGYTGTPTIYRTDWQGIQKLYPTARTNTCSRSEPTKGQLAASSAGISDVSAPSPFSGNSIQFPGVVQLDYAYAPCTGGGSVIDPIVSVFVKMDSGNAPVFVGSSTSGDFHLVANGGAITVGSMISVSTTSTPGIYKVSGKCTGTHAAGSGFGVFRYATNSGLGFKVMGFQIEPSAGLSGPTSYILTNGATVTVTDYTINGSGLVTLANTTNPVIGQNLGIANGSTSAFAVNTPNASTPTVTGVWRTDWQGRQRMYQTARTNLALQNNAIESLAEWGGLSGMAITSTTATAPDGTSTAREITTSSVAVSRSQLVAVTPLTSYVHSFWVKRGTIGDLKYSVYNATGAADIVPATSFYSQTSASQWVKVSISFTTPAGCIAVRIYVLRNDTGSIGTFYSWGHQLELGVTPTATIPTAASAVTVTDYSVSGSTITFATNPLSGAVIEADYTYTGGLGVGNTLSWGGTYTRKYVATWTPPKPDAFNSWSISADFREVPA